MCVCVDKSFVASLSVGQLCDEASADFTGECCRK